MHTTATERDRTPIDAAFVRDRRWRMTRSDGSEIAPMLRLDPQGRIGGATDENENAWRVRDGRLEFLRRDGTVMTSFDTVSRNEHARHVLTGRYLGENPRGTLHVLTELSPRVPPLRRPRVAVLVRTHLLTDKLFDLLAVLRNGVGYDLFVCADETRGVLDLPGEDVIGHSAGMCADLGLVPSAPNAGLLWYFGDYAFYCAYKIIPDYDYYVMIEYDVDFVQSNASLLEALLNRLDGLGDQPYDLVATHYATRPPEWAWSRTCEGRFDAVYGVLFPLVVLSQRALEYLYEWRLSEAAAKQGAFVFCEAFVPSALQAAGGFRCADLSTLFPGCWDRSTFRIGAPMLLGSLPALSRRVGLLHPVFSEREYLKRLFDDAVRGDTLPAFIDTLARDQTLALSSMQRAEYLAKGRLQLNLAR